MKRKLKAYLIYKQEGNIERMKIDLDYIKKGISCYGNLKCNGYFKT